MANKRINVVFQGGGVRGIAHVGALKAIQAHKDIEVVGVGGSSVGAMVACLLAAGYTANQLDEEMRRKPLHTLLGSPNRNVRQFGVEIQNARQEIEALWKRYESRFGSLKVLWYCKTLVERLRNLVATITEVFSDYGLYDTRELVKWLGELLEKKHIVTIGDWAAAGSVDTRLS
jgi:predicted acylesterase/phospholipase RssA